MAADASRPAASLGAPGNGPRSAPELTIVIPTFNEAANVPLLVAGLRQTLAGVEWEAIFVDDDSPDGTAAAVRQIGAGDARVRCLRRIGRRGLAGACIEGILASQSPNIAVMDADLQHSEEALLVMLDRMRGGDVDVVVASRYLDSATNEGLSRLRSQISIKAIAVARRLLAVRMTDPMSGFFMIRRDAFEALAPRLSSQGFKILLDIVATSRGQLRVAEIPYVFRARQFGESKLDSRVMLDYLGLLLAKLTNDLVSIRFVSFGIVGLSGVVVHMLALALALKTFGLGFVEAQIIATLLAITSNYALNNAVTYGDLRLRGAAFFRGWIVFALICGLGAISNVGIARSLYQQHVEWSLAGLSGAVIGVIWNYMVSRMFVWRDR